MSRTTQHSDVWLIAAGYLFTAVAGLSAAWVHFTGDRSLHPMTFMFIAFIALVIVVGLRHRGNRFRWSSITVFALWLTAFSSLYLLAWLKPAPLYQ